MNGQSSDGTSDGKSIVQGERLTPISAAVEGLSCDAHEVRGHGLRLVSFARHVEHFYTNINRPRYTLHDSAAVVVAAVASKRAAPRKRPLGAEEEAESARGRSAWQPPTARADA